MGLELVVAVLRAPVEAKGVLEAGAASTLDGDPQDLGVAGRLVSLELLDLRGRALGERDNGDGFLEGRHEPIVPLRLDPPNPPFCADFVTAAARIVERFLRGFVRLTATC